MVAKRFGTSVDRLAAVNGIQNRHRVTAGTRLIIPDGFDGAPSRPVVRPSATHAVVAAAPRGISVEQLRRIMPNLSLPRARQYLPFLNSAMNEGGITTPKRRAAFLAQVAHESGQLRFFEEIASGAQYEGRLDLGNVRPGDGRRYKGRGPIQLTGRTNYRAAGRALGIDLEGNPRRAADPDVGFRVAAWYWRTRGLNALADQGDFRTITERINGGTRGLADRQRFWERAKAVLGA